MKKVGLAVVFFSLAVFAAAQTTPKTRPRIVPSATPETRYPTIQNDTRTGTTERKAPVLIDNTSSKPGTMPPPPPPLTIEADEDDVIRVDTNFVTLPVTVLDRQGRFVPGLGKNDFEIFDNGNREAVDIFASVETPFTVVLLIDTSPSTKYKIEEIQSAAVAFVNQLRSNDRIMVVSFDRNYRVLTPPTSDRGRLTSAIYRAQFGDGTSLYDAVNRTIDDELRQIEGRKAIVLFTDGVDTTSNRANFESTVRKAEEADALIYPIRYDTSGQYSQNRRGGGRSTSTGSILGDILVGILGGTTGGNVSIGGAGQSPQEYARGKEYLEELAKLTGGRTFEADTTSNLDNAFRSIAEELRRQYSLGYYPEITGKNGDRRSIRVRVKRSNLVVRTKRSYIVGQGG